MGACGKCIHKKTVATDYPCAVCDFVTYYEEAIPQTNADRIRKMSDEELAGFIYETALNPVSVLKVHINQTIVEWLKQEVSE